MPSIEESMRKAAGKSRDVGLKKEIVSLENLDTPRAKDKRVAFDADAMRAFRLLNAKLAIEKQIIDLKDLEDLGADIETRKGIDREINVLEKNRSEIVKNLGELRPDDFGDEAAFERALEKPAKRLNEEIETAVQEKDTLEEQVLALKNSIRLLEDRLKETPADATEPEDELAEARFELFRLHHERLKSWDKLAHLSPEQYGADAELEHSLFEEEKKKMKSKDESEARETADDIRGGISKLK
jgi:hypothetical protein